MIKQVNCYNTAEKMEQNPEFSSYEVVTAQVKPFGLTRLENFNNGTLCPSDAIPSLPVYLSGEFH